PVANVPSPQVAGNAEGKLDSGDAQKLQASLRNLPTRDPSLEQVSAGSPPPLELAGDADPKQAQDQRTKLEKGVADAHTQGQQDLAQPMGENEIYPQVPQETLRAEGIGAGSAAGGGAAAKGVGAGGAAGDDAVSIIAQQEKGSEIQAAVAKAQAEIAAKRQEHTTQVAQEKTRSNQEITRLQQENSTQQAQERAKAQGEVSKLRSDWQQEQDTLVQKSRTEADEAVSKGNQDVAKEQTEAEKQAAEHIKKGDEDAAVARRQGEEEAEKERQKGEQESGGILGWLADKAKAFFDGIKQAIQKAFEVARAAVKAAIEGAQKLATAVIEAGRKAIVGIIKAVGDVLIAIGDKLLAAFPELRDRFRNAIKSAVKVAEDAVNALANTLKKGVQAALNLLAKGLDAALGLLEKGMMAAVDLANQAVQGAIKFADAAIKAMAAFAVLVKDISANPGQWLSNLGGGANDGIRNHFWGAFQTAVQEWFSQKVEEVLGLGMTVWNVLKQGGINTAEVGKMAWEGIKSAIPGVLIGILIEKVVSMIVPAAGTVMVIIEGLQAAWGTVSRILQAFERFMAFLKAVKTGQAGPPFGAALASAGVVVIDFVANWLLKRLRGPASKVAGKIKEIAKKIGKKVKKALKKVKRKLKRKARKLKDKFFGKKKDTKGDKGKGRESDHHKDKNNKEDKEKKNKERLDKAVRELKPKIDALVRRGVSGIRLRSQLAFWKISYRLSRLSLERQGASLVRIHAQVNPEADVTTAYMPQGEELRNLIHDVAEEIRQRPDVQAMAQSMESHAGTKEDPIDVPSGLGLPALVEHMRSGKRSKGQPWKSHRRYKVGETVVTETQAPGHEYNAHVAMGGASAYPKISSKTLSNMMQDTGMTDARVAVAFRDYIRGKQLPEELRNHTAKFDRLKLLLFGREAIRNPGMIAFSPMTLSLIASNKDPMTWHEALAAYESDPNRLGGRGVLPMSMKDAQASALELEEERRLRKEAEKNGKPAPAIARSDNAKELARREIELATRWLTTMMKAEGLQAFKDQNHAQEFIKQKIVDFYVGRRRK
ncbi:MAG TPA: hypothetical protein DCL61_11440, partial [Cyanobacteria bacterium UBA12227]|nr:hypothetical protein [Cyanobacteria bacterium UBA12227]